MKFEDVMVACLSRDAFITRQQADAANLFQPIFQSFRIAFAQSGLFIQAFEYYTFVTHDNFGINSGVYGTLFYTMTGFHGAHVTGGVIGLAVILIRGMQGQFSARHHTAVEAVHYYWHFVDIVWVALFLVLYVLR